jgi:hypothetical protein
MTVKEVAAMFGGEPTMNHLLARVEALEHHMQSVERRLRWWRGLACGLVALGLLGWVLQAGYAADAPTGPVADRLAAVEAKLVHLTSATDQEGRPEVVITGANLRIVNGLGRTDCGSEEEPIPDCPNGLGNLIVGYNELRDPEFFENIRTGSHNVVVGKEHNFSRFGGLVVGDFNEISGDFAVVSGGQLNTANGDFASVSGGNSNTASGVFASVSGGQGNRASGDFASVSGGNSNTASGNASAVSGGLLNTASSGPAAICGGAFNTASASNAVICGGSNNTASGENSSVSGGSQNTASGENSSVSGGLQRTAAGEFDWVAGPLFADE